MTTVHSYKKTKLFGIAAIEVLDPTEITEIVVQLEHVIGCPLNRYLPLPYDHYLLPELYMNSFVTYPMPHAPKMAWFLTRHRGKKASVLIDMHTGATFIVVVNLPSPWFLNTVCIGTMSTGSVPFRITNVLVAEGVALANMPLSDRLAFTSLLSIDLVNGNNAFLFDVIPLTNHYCLKVDDVLSALNNVRNPIIVVPWTMHQYHLMR